jgi:1-acyl-sn-glycerol-3-phosphate acyltransferase
MIFYRIYQICVMLPIMLAATVITSIIVAIGSICGDHRFWGYYPAMIWGRIMAWSTLVSVTVRGRENVQQGQSYVFVANHQGAYDIFAIYGWLGHNFKWMMKKSLERIPLVGYACRKAGHIYVDKSSPSAVRETMEKAEKQLAGGMSVVVFPEGSRTRNGKLSRFKRGAYMLAEEFNLPVVPITIDGAYDVMPITAKVPRIGHITVTIHKPIDAPAGGHDLAALMEQSREAIASALPERNK